MATGSGKTIAAITAINRLIRFAGARRVLFLVDRTNLGEQAEKEFQAYRAPDSHRKFTELYNVQRLTSNTIMDSSRVVIATVQRVYSMLKGESVDPLTEEMSQFEMNGAALAGPLPVVNPRHPPEYFDVIVIDEVHRSIYTLWRQVVEYFDAFLIGLTATPSKQTFGFFNRNLVMEYDHERAVADGVNVDFDVYEIRTKITRRGSTVEAHPDTMLGYRDRQTRALRWETPDEDLSYDANELDRRVVAKDQIRTIIRTFRDRWSVDIFPGRKELPKTLIFAKHDSHAEDIVEIVRDEFGRGNAFCQEITYKVTSADPRDLIQAFRNQYEPRIAVTVDMVATGTDIKPIEIVMFMRAVKSRVLFEQMKGRGVRVIDPNDLRAVSGEDAVAKSHFVIVDCVGMTETQLADTQPLDRKRYVSLNALLEHVAMGGTDPAMLSSLASRLSRLDKQCGPEEHARVADVSGGPGLGEPGRAAVWQHDDPACGTGGFLLATHEYVTGRYELDRDQKRHLRFRALRGVELVPNVARLCGMNLYLHGIGPDGSSGHEPPIQIDDTLRNEPDVHADVVVTNPPFGKRSSITIVNEEGESDRQSLTYNRPDLWTTTSNKQLNFIQHVKALLKIHGRAAVVVPDNVLFEGGAGEIVRRNLLNECDVHTLLRLPTGIFYAQGVKANVLFFDRKPGAKEPWTKTVWVYDLRTNKHFTLKTRRMTRADLDEFVGCYRPGDRHNRQATWSDSTPDGRWRPYSYDEILNRDKVSLDLFWLRDESLEDSANLPDPHVLAQEIADDLRSALAQIEDVLGDLEQRVDDVVKPAIPGLARQR